jgi:hypothetical protein
MTKRQSIEGVRFGLEGCLIIMAFAISTPWAQKSSFIYTTEPLEIEACMGSKIRKQFKLSGDSSKIVVVELKFETVGVASWRGKKCISYRERLTERMVGKGTYYSASPCNSYPCSGSSSITTSCGDESVCEGDLIKSTPAVIQDIYLLGCDSHDDTFCKHQLRDIEISSRWRYAWKCLSVADSYLISNPRYELRGEVISINGITKEKPGLIRIEVVSNDRGSMEVCIGVKCAVGKGIVETRKYGKEYRVNGSSVEGMEGETVLWMCRGDNCQVEQMACGEYRSEVCGVCRASVLKTCGGLEVDNVTVNVFTDQGLFYDWRRHMTVSEGECWLQEEDEDPLMPEGKLVEQCITGSNQYNIREQKGELFTGYRQCSISKTETDWRVAKAEANLGGYICNYSQAGVDLMYRGSRTGFCRTLNVELSIRGGVYKVDEVVGSGCLDSLECIDFENCGRLRINNRNDKDPGCVGYESLRFVVDGASFKKLAPTLGIGTVEVYGICTSRNGSVSISIVDESGRVRAVECIVYRNDTLNTRPNITYIKNETKVVIGVSVDVFGFMDVLKEVRRDIQCSLGLCWREYQYYLLGILYALGAVLVYGLI